MPKERWVSRWFAWQGTCFLASHPTDGSGETLNSACDFSCGHPVLITQFSSGEIWPTLVVRIFLGESKGLEIRT